MKLGVVGPARSVDEVRQIIVDRHMPIEFVPLVYEKYTDAVEIVKREQKELDAILFTGMLPFEYVSHYIRAECPWGAPPKDKLSLAFSLLKASVLQGYDITKISFDNVDDVIVDEAYKELGYAKKDVDVSIFYDSPFSAEYVDKLLAFHRGNLLTGKARCCVSGVELVYIRLIEEGFPCIMNSKIVDVIVSEINRLLLSKKINLAQQELFSTLAIEVEFSTNHPVYERSIFQHLTLTNKVRGQIHLFAQNFGGAVFEVSESLFYICGKKDSLALETDRLRHLPLMRELLKIEIVKDIFVGVGIYSSMNRSKRLADIAKQNARQYGASCMFVIYGDEGIVGPILEKSQSAPSAMQYNLEKISKESKVSIQTISRIDAIIRQYGVDTIESKQLADLYGGNKRSFYRCLEKLMDAGYVKVVSSGASNKPGRPSRIIKISFELE